MVAVNRKISIVLVVGIVLILFASGCSNKVNTWASRQYHMATTRWNVYFNGKESMRKGQELIAQNHTENFDKLLPVYFENNIQARETASSEMERAVGKSVKAIELHSITAKPKRKKGKRESEKYREFRRKKEYNNMIDECYLLLGKAQFYRREYYSTERTFRYILREFSDLPMHYEAAIWYARTLGEQNKYFRALRTIEDVMDEEGFPEDLIPMARAAKADFYIRRGVYDKAIEELEYLTKNTKKKEGQTRYYYILAQLHTMQGDIEKAQATYVDLVATHPEYEYAFHAQLTKALLYGQYDLAESETKVKSELRKLIRDGRNKEYLDQVYYTLAKLYDKAGDIEKAEENYLLAAEHNSTNAKQQAKTLLALGNLYFEKKKEYTLAFENYDAASKLITEDYPQYEEVKVRLEALTQLAENLKTVEVQDSLRKIAKMPTFERENFIKELMMAEREAVKGKSRREKRLVQKSMQSIDRPIGEWYFYNPMAVAKGKKDFEKRWGVLNLTDNWRTEQQKFQLSAEERSELSSDTIKFRTYEDYVAELPLTEDAMEDSKLKSINALYDAGVVYEDGLDDYVQAKSTFEKALERKPENEEKRLRTHYHLYILNSLLDNTAEADKHKQLIMAEFPDSDLAKVLQDPRYYKKMAQRGKDAESLYQQAYEAYVAKNFQESKSLSAEGMEQFKGTATYQRFAFLNAMSKAYTDSTEEFRKALQEVKSVAIDKKILATTQGLLVKLDAGKVPNQNVNKEQKTYTSADFERPTVVSKKNTTKLVEKVEIPKVYKFEEKTKHYFALILPRDLRAGVQKDVEAFNQKNFSEKGLRARRRNFSLNTDMILVESFQNKEDAMLYLGQMIIAQNDFLKAINEVDYTNIIISEKNLLKLSADRNILPYLDFYSYYYFGEGEPLEEEQEEKPLDTKEQLENSTKVDTNNLQPEVSFVANNEAKYHFVLVVPRRGTDVNYLWTALHNFDENFRVKKEKLGDKRMLVVENVGNKKEAMEYLRKVVTVDYIYEDLQGVDYRNFIITKENLDVLRATKAVDNYIQFFKDNYLTK